MLIDYCYDRKSKQEKSEEETVENLFKDNTKMPPLEQLTKFNSRLP